MHVAVANIQFVRPLDQVFAGVLWFVYFYGQQEVAESTFFFIW